MSNLNEAIEHFENDRGLREEFAFTLAAMKEAQNTIAGLKEPATVWANMLRGEIARPAALEHYEACKAEIERLTADLSTARQSLVEMASQRNGAVAQVRAAFESGYKAGLSVPDGFFGRTMESEWDKYAASTRLAKKGLVKLKPGRYDDVYQEGVRWLNESD